jgi:hypothetical protein
MPWELKNWGNKPEGGKLLLSCTVCSGRPLLDPMASNLFHPSVFTFIPLYVLPQLFQRRPHIAPSLDSIPLWICFLLNLSRTSESFFSLFIIHVEWLAIGKFFLFNSIENDSSTV